MANRATILSIWALAVSLTGFVWWNLRPASVSLVSLGPHHCQVETRGPGWPFPAYTESARWSRPDVPTDELFRTPDQEAAAWERRAADDPRLHEFAETVATSAERGHQNRWVLNGLVAGLLTVALVANIARGLRETRQSGDTDRYYLWVGVLTLVMIAAAVLAVLVGVGVAIRSWVG